MRKWWELGKPAFEEESVEGQRYARGHVAIQTMRDIPTQLGFRGSRWDKMK